VFLGFSSSLSALTGKMLVAVVGAGMGGLASIKNCLEEGLEVVAFEKESSGMALRTH
jgi:cation diffusion facilitator CzcD-associated flavoprotein CzcO